MAREREREREMPPSLGEGESAAAAAVSTPSAAMAATHRVGKNPTEPTKRWLIAQHGS